MSEILARRSLRKEHLRKPHDKKSTPAKPHGIWREKYISSRPRTKARSAPVLVSKHTEERMFVVDSGASLSKKDLTSDGMDTLRRSRNPTTVGTANGEVHAHDLDLFATVQLLAETPAVLSLGKLRSEHGCSNEWKKRVKLND